MIKSALGKGVVCLLAAPGRMDKVQELNCATYLWILLTTQRALKSLCRHAKSTAVRSLIVCFWLWR